MKTLLSILIVLAVQSALGQLNQQLYKDHGMYMEPAVATRRVKHEDVVRALKSHGKEFRIRQVGRSVEGRSINMISYGNGPVNVLMWSQMHGDESTATRAILDVIRFLQNDDAYNDLRRKVQSGITLHFIPMLNPDGAARFTRRNHDGIDINRDAQRLQTPEGRILKKVRDSLSADWGFNLHDQNRGTSVNGKPATISLLAPPFNLARDVNESRGDAMQLTKYMHDQIIGFIPGQIGIYPDDFEPRAFGDNIQKWGTRTVLIESGGFADDWEKQEVRRLNFVLLLTAVDAIVSKKYEAVAAEAYNTIPKNSDGRMLELILYSVRYEGLLRDIGWERREAESEDFRSYSARGGISDIGDLSTSQAYVTFNATDYDVTAGKVYETVLADGTRLAQLPLDKLMREGYTDFVVKEAVGQDPKMPRVNTHQKPPTIGLVQLGANPSLLLKKNGILECVVINGVLYRLN